MQTKSSQKLKILNSQTRIAVSSHFTIANTTSLSRKLQNNPMDSIDRWAELFVREMLRASTVEDGKARASRLLENFKKSIWELATAGINEAFEHGDALFHENTKLKQAVAIQHELQKEYEKRNLELQQLVSQYQIGLRNLQAKNFALTIQNQRMKNFSMSSHLQQTQQSNSIPRRFPTP